MSAVTTNVNAGMITSSPGPTPTASRTRRRASVPDANADAVSGAAVPRKLSLERVDLGAEDVLATRENRTHCALDLRTDDAVLTTQVDERHHA